MTVLPGGSVLHTTCWLFKLRKYIMTKP